MPDVSENHAHHQVADACRDTLVQVVATAQQRRRRDGGRRSVAQLVQARLKVGDDHNLLGPAVRECGQHQHR
ncbi:Uncharacterised protein [Mycobacteroides abscessus subsp. abscessus]|nr:Uncharacterised protein [Mycobacteroides abscessus subsp. abscessus]